MAKCIKGDALRLSPLCYLSADVHRSRLTTVSEENVLVSTVIVHFESLGWINVVKLRCVLPSISRQPGSKGVSLSIPMAEA